MDRLVTTYSTVDWSPDRSVVTKTRLPAIDARRRFRNELRVNRLLDRLPPPVETPRLVGWDVQRRRLSFVAVPGEPMGPKYPLALPPDEVDAVIDIAHRMRGFTPERRWLRRLDTARRLRSAQHVGLLSAAQTDRLIGVADRVHRKLRFAHGDLTARNVLAGTDGHTLIDWEWAGLYPDGYELAFFWFSLVDVAHGRTRIEERVEGDMAAFLLSALLVQLWHLQWYVPPDFRAEHEATRDDLVSRLLS